MIVSKAEADIGLNSVVISLKRSPDRLTAFRNRFGSSAERVGVLPGIDGDSLDVGRLLEQGFIHVSALDWPRGQLGCSLSHLRCLLHCLSTNRPLLVFEDDAIASHQWQDELIPLLADAPADWDLLLLGCNLDSCLQLEWAENITITGLFQPKFPSSSQLQQALAAPGSRRWFGLRKAFGLAGYVVSPKGAARILEFALPLRTLPIHAPELPEISCFSLDGQLNALYPELSAWACMPPLVIGANHKPSSLTNQ